MQDEAKEQPKAGAAAAHPGKGAVRRHPNRPLFYVGSVLLTVLVVFLVGLFMGRGQIEPRRDAAARQLAASRKEVQTARTELAGAQRLNRLILARGWLYRSAVALDRRNFGLATDFVGKAAKSLTAVQPTEMGSRAADFSVLRDQLVATNINVALDLDQQRTHLLELAERMDRLVPE